MTRWLDQDEQRAWLRLAGVMLKLSPALDSQLQLRTLLARIGARLVDHEPPVAIGDAVTKCSPNGDLVDPAALADIEQLVATTVATLHPSLVPTGATP